MRLQSSTTMVSRFMTPVRDEPWARTGAQWRWAVHGVRRRRVSERRTGREALVHKPRRLFLHTLDRVFQIKTVRKHTRHFIKAKARRNRALQCSCLELVHTCYITYALSIVKSPASEPRAMARKLSLVASAGLRTHSISPFASGATLQPDVAQKCHASAMHGWRAQAHRSCSKAGSLVTILRCDVMRSPLTGT